MSDITTVLSQNHTHNRLFTVEASISGLLFIGFLFLTYQIVGNHSLVALDRQLMDFVIQHRTPEMAPVFRFITELGSGGVITSLGLVLVLLFRFFGNTRPAYFLITSIIVGQAGYWAFKQLVQRLRPDEMYAWVERGGYSFPSGHTTSATLFYGLVGYFVWRFAKKLWAKALVIGVFGSIILLIGVSRLYLGVHWPTDVLAGWLLGSSLLAIYIGLFIDRYGVQWLLNWTTKK